jgi:putative ABC transport system ATP-binding protein
MSSGNGSRQGPAIQVIDVVKVYDNMIRALDGVNLMINYGEFVALMGPSGCGKSTLLHLLAALDNPTAGRIIVNGRDLRSAGNDRYRRMEIGLVFQLHNLLPNLNALENVQIPMFGTGMNHAERLKRAKELLDEMGLQDREKMTPPRLSGGERQRLAIARALANNPSIILADEPTGNLDSAAVDRLLALFRGVRDEHQVTILLATHDTHVASAADHVVHMRDGRIVERPQSESQPTTVPSS